MACWPAVLCQLENDIESLVPPSSRALLLIGSFLSGYGSQVVSCGRGETHHQDKLFDGAKIGRIFLKIHF
jgi:hypothetical protein